MISPAVWLGLFGNYEMFHGFVPFPQMTAGEHFALFVMSAKESIESYLIHEIREVFITLCVRQLSRAGLYVIRHRRWPGGIL